MRRLALTVAVVLVTGAAAVAQEQEQERLRLEEPMQGDMRERLRLEPTAEAPVAATEPRPVSLTDACVAVLRGERAPSADLAPRCEGLLRAGASGEVTPDVGRSAPRAGESVRAAFTDAGRELIGRGRSPAGLGATERGPVRSTLMTNPLGWFSGLGVNAELTRAIDELPKLSWIAGARYSRANATNGNVTTFGLGGGADLFILGRNNEGLRVGPRLELAFGREDFGGRTTFGRLGASGEVGYNFIASNGLSASAAGGLGTRLAGDSQNEEFESFTGGEFGPYLKLGLGYSF